MQKDNQRLSLLLSLHRENDAAEIKAAIISSWPVSEQFEYLRNSLREQIKFVSEITGRTNKLMANMEESDVKYARLVQRRLEKK